MVILSSVLSEACRLFAASFAFRSFSDFTSPVPVPKVILVAVPPPVAPMVRVRPARPPVAAVPVLVAEAMPVVLEAAPAAVTALVAMLAVFMAPFAAMIVQMAISRTREFGADRAGAEISGDPRALASALAKIAGPAQRMPSAAAHGNPAAAQLYIVPTQVSELFSTHPATEKRIAALMALDGIAPSSAPVRPVRRSALDPNRLH